MAGDIEDVMAEVRITNGFREGSFDWGTTDRQSV
jgi:hypothetical protein